ncbi:hypothetical protein EMPG_16276 [Blastomyces silverae]|uniref:Uncharacterized protein n=1 Tax=Blastomyces silverae TaxID=2060906 RepID=A0A0H1BGL7_9EURO|nr:hypothetical protein EMPG_16276 [Blastomyces silverae]
MSGSNPFRHKKKPTSINDQTAPQQLHQPLQASSISVHSNHSNHSAAVDPAAARTHGEGPSQPSHRQKSVRIASPPVATQPSVHLSAGDHPSPASNRASILHHGTHRGSPPPPSVEESSGSEDDSAGDPFNPDASGSDNEDYRDIGQGRRVEEGKTEVIGLGLEEAQRASREPYGAERAVITLGLDPNTSRSDSMTPLPSATKGKRETMDVDAFTRMLMTGKTGGAGKEPVSAARQPLQPTQGPAISDSSSNTDTGSTSKRPIFEPRNLPRIETPRTSHELSTSEADDERRKLAAALPKPAERPKPPPPKTRRGKPINPNTGQTSPLVGLASFTSPNHRSASPASLSSRSFTEQESGDVNKPLPHPPVDNSFLSVSPEQASQDSENLSPLPHQKRPPTPPLARRHSQMKPSNPRLSRNNSARHSMPPTNIINNSTTASSIHSPSPLKSPPPPPSRRKDRESSAFSSSDTPPLLPHERRQASSRPRSDSRDDTSDKSSLRSVETASTISNKRASQHGPPRPPPPRRGGGSRASLDESRPVLLGATDSSTARIDMKDAEDAKSGAPGIPSQSQSQSQSQSHAVDILADLTRLQKEVDDLRGRYSGRKSSG